MMEEATAAQPPFLSLSPSPSSSPSSSAFSSGFSSPFSSSGSPPSSSSSLPPFPSSVLSSSSPSSSFSSSSSAVPTSSSLSYNRAPALYCYCAYLYNVRAAPAAAAPAVPVAAAPAAIAPAPAAGNAAAVAPGAAAAAPAAIAPAPAAGNAAAVAPGAAVAPAAAASSQITVSVAVVSCADTAAATVSSLPSSFLPIFRSVAAFFRGEARKFSFLSSFSKKLVLQHLMLLLLCIILLLHLSYKHIPPISALPLSSSPPRMPSLRPSSFSVSSSLLDPSSSSVPSSPSFPSSSSLSFSPSSPSSSAIPSSPSFPSSSFLPISHCNVRSISRLGPIATCTVSLFPVVRSPAAAPMLQQKSESYLSDYAPDINKKKKRQQHMQSKGGQQQQQHIQHNGPQQQVQQMQQQKIQQRQLQQMQQQMLQQQQQVQQLQQQTIQQPQAQQLQQQKIEQPQAQQRLASVFHSVRVIGRQPQQQEQQQRGWGQQQQIEILSKKQDIQRGEQYHTDFFLFVLKQNPRWFQIFSRESKQQSHCEQTRVWGGVGCFFKNIHTVSVHQKDGFKSKSSSSSSLSSSSDASCSRLRIQDIFSTVSSFLPLHNIQAFLLPSLSHSSSAAARQCSNTPSAVSTPHVVGAANSVVVCCCMPRRCLPITHVSSTASPFSLPSAFLQFPISTSPYSSSFPSFSSSSSSSSSASPFSSSSSCTFMSHSSFADAFETVSDAATTAENKKKEENEYSTFSSSSPFPPPSSSFFPSPSSSFFPSPSSFPSSSSPSFSPPFPSSPSSFSSSSSFSPSSSSPHSSSSFSSPFPSSSSSSLSPPPLPSPYPGTASHLDQSLSVATTTSPVGRPLDMIEGGALQQLQQLQQEKQGLLKAGKYLNDWQDGEERDLELLVTQLDEAAAVTPGQKTVIQLPPKERHRLINGIMRTTRAAVVLLGYVDASEDTSSPLSSSSSVRSSSHAGSSLHTQQGNAIGEQHDQILDKQKQMRDSGYMKKKTEEDYMLIGFAAVAEPTELQLLDRSGEMGLRILGRLCIRQVLEASDDKFVVRVVPHREERRSFVNPHVSRENIKALYRLYERVNKAELHFRKLQGKMHQAHLVSLRPTLEDKVDEFLNEMVPAPTEKDIGEWVSFCAMDHHLDARARCWAMAQQDTELRLDVVRRALEDKLKRLQTESACLEKNPLVPQSPEDPLQYIPGRLPSHIKI